MLNWAIGMSPLIRAFWPHSTRDFPAQEVACSGWIYSRHSVHTPIDSVTTSPASVITFGSPTQWRVHESIRACFSPLIKQ